MTFETEYETVGRPRRSAAEAVVRVLGHLLMAAAMVLCTLYGGWVATKLWSWYLVPLGWAPVSVRTAVGTVLLLGVPLTGPMVLLALVRNKQEGNAKQTTGDRCVLLFLFLLLYTTLLISGWFYKTLL